MKHYLQMQVNDKWLYVFAIHRVTDAVETTTVKADGITGEEHLFYFKTRYPDNEFRMVVRV